MVRARWTNTPGCCPDGAGPTGTPILQGAGVKTTWMSFVLREAASPLPIPWLFLFSSQAASLLQGVRSCCLSSEGLERSSHSPASPREGCARVGAQDAAQNDLMALVSSAWGEQEQLALPWPESRVKPLGLGRGLAQTPWGAGTPNVVICY